MTTHSFSSISKWVQCPKQYHETYILKKWRQPESEAMRRGNVIHKELEDYLNGARTKPPTLAPKDGLLDMMKAAGAKPELPLALDRDLKPTDFWDKNAWLRGKLDVVIEQAEPLLAIDWKGLALNTPLPTPHGWTSMGMVQVGDTLFGGDGHPCTVTGKSRVKHLPCYEITFDDCSYVVCDEEHLWAVEGRGVIRTKAVRPNDHIRLASPLVLLPAGLPIDPYVLGLWLADGKHTSGEVSKPDAFVWEEVQRRGYKIGGDISGRDRTCPTRTIYGIRGALKDLGVLGAKHIPEVYLRGSYEQRLDLLRGLMDGDGNANPTRKQAVFTTVDKRLSDDVMELALSLGQRVNQSQTTQRGFGLTVEAWPLHFRPQAINPFSLPRKADRIDPGWGPGRSGSRRVVSVQRTKTRPTQCIAVNSIDNTYLCTQWFIPTHNTGKKRANDLQADVYHMLLAGNYPKAGKIQIVFDYLEKGRQPPYQPGGSAVGRVVGLMTRIEESKAFPPRPTALCGWCPVQDCEYWENR